MAKKPPKQEPVPAEKPRGPFTTTRVYRDVVRMAGFVADRRGIDLYEYLDGLLRGPVRADFAEEQRKEIAGE